MGPKLLHVGARSVREFMAPTVTASHTRPGESSTASCPSLPAAITDSTPASRASQMAVSIGMLGPPPHEFDLTQGFDGSALFFAETHSIARTASVSDPEPSPSRN